MYVTAHRVKVPRGRRQGINAYIHRHGDLPWPSSPEQVLDLIQQQPGELVDQELGLEPIGGNTVLSYFDLVAPDDTPRQNLIEAIDALHQVGVSDGLAVIALGPVVVRLGVARARLDHWETELHDLARSAEDLIRKDSRLKSGRPSLRTSSASRASGPLSPAPSRKPNPQSDLRRRRRK